MTTIQHIGAFLLIGALLWVLLDWVFGDRGGYTVTWDEPDEAGDLLDLYNAAFAREQLNGREYTADTADLQSRRP